MSAVFTTENTIIDRHTGDWRKALEVVGALLEKTGAATAEYAGAMIAAVENLGPYIVIVPHIALAHAAAGTHVRRDGLCLAVFRQPIVFGSANDPVHIIIGLCALSAGSHLEQFRLFANLLENEDLCQKIRACDSETRLCELLSEL